MTGNIYMTGFMGAGKTTVGRRLARELALPFEDLDQRIEAAEGRSIARIFKEDGEPAFRRLEVLHARDLPAPGVFALGGGALSNPGLLRRLRQTGTLVFLDWPFPVLLRRIRGDSTRPLAMDEAGLAALYQSRLPQYRRADLIWTSRPPHRETAAFVAREIAAKIRSLYLGC